jgi:hypothetical protein
MLKIGVPGGSTCRRSWLRRLPGISLGCLGSKPICTQKLTDPALMSMFPGAG